VRLLAHLVLFKALYLVAVGGATHGRPWAGALALVPFLALHLTLVPAGLRRRELGFLAAVGLAGTAVDSGLFALGLIGFGSVPDPWPPALVPPWISALWVAFATLPGAMRWLRGRPLRAALFGALGGPLSFWLGARLGATALPDPPLGLAALAFEYALAMPLLVRLAPRTVTEAPRRTSLAGTPS
jgi:hypothetical protein